MEVEIISKQYIKPSSPTPQHLRTYKLSLLDQFVPSLYTPLLLFYPMNNNQDTKTSADTLPEIISKRSLLLKQSLSETLTLFCTFAGKIQDNLSIDCNDEGAYYVEARVSSPMSEYLTQNDFTSTYKFLPRTDPLSSRGACFLESTPGSHVAMIQETTFSCGGLIIGVYVSHFAADGIAFSSFVKSWAAAARSSSQEIVHPNFDASSIFPQISAYPTEATLFGLMLPFARLGKGACWRFVFDASAMDRLKSDLTSSGVESPTRFEAVSALLCKCIRNTLNHDRPTLISTIVNMRRRSVPHLPEGLMGNLIGTAATVVYRTNEETDYDLSSLAWQLREAVGKVDSEFVKSLQGEGGAEKLPQIFVKERSAAFEVGNGSTLECIAINSWCNFGLYQVDFGWGKPIWTTTSFSGPVDDEQEVPIVDTIFLMDTKEKGGVEALVILARENMALLQHHNELLAYASVNPPILLED